MANPKQHPLHHLHKAQNLNAESNKRTSIPCCIPVRELEPKNYTKPNKNKNFLNANQIEDKDERVLLMPVTCA